MMKMKSSSFRLFLLVGYSTLVSPLPDLSRLIGDHVNSHPRGIRRGQAGGYYGDNDNDGVFCEPIEDSTYSDAADAFAEKSSYSCAPTNAGQICTIDFTPVVEVGDMDTLLTLCQDAGGGLYLGAATTSCESGAFLNKYIDYPLCQSNCNDDLINTFIFEGASVNDDPDDDCIFSSVEYLYEYGGENNSTKPTVPPTTSPTPYPSSHPISSPLSRTSAPSDGLSLGICEDIENPTLGDVFGDLFYNKYIYECGALGLSCTVGFDNTVVEEGGFDKVLRACQDADGGLYVYTVSVSCDDDVDGPSNFESKNMPFCLARCAVDLLKEFIVKGGPVGDDCIFTSVDNIYEYSGNNNNTKPTVPPTTSPTPYPSTTPGNYTLSPTLGPTLSPASNRTNPPSPPSSSSSCDDSPLMFMVHDIPRCCKWVARNPTERCDEMWAKGADLDIHVKSHCPKSCGSCDKYGCSDTVGAFIVDNHEHRECCWLDSLSESHRVELCSENRIYTTCQDTCGIPCTQ